jgi:hypothetical protein
MTITSLLLYGSGTLTAGAGRYAAKASRWGIKMTGDGHQSDTAAQFAGKQALAEFLAALSKEEKRPRK